MKGKISLDELKELVQKEEIETVVVAFSDHFGRLMGKRFDADFFLESGARDGTHGCDYLLTTDMEMEPIPGYKYANWEKGYGDFHLVPDLETLRIATWLDKTALVLCDVDDNKTHKPTSVAPRSILNRQIAAMNDMRYNAYAASELEYYLFDTPYREAYDKGYSGLKSSGWYLEDYHILQGSRIEHFTGAARKTPEEVGSPGGKF